MVKVLMWVIPWLLAHADELLAAWRAVRAREAKRRPFEETE